MTVPSAETCHVCQASRLARVERYASFRRVASDCTPWRSGGSLAICQLCGCVQAVTNSDWHAEAAEIYQNYSIWHQSGGAEQSTFDSASGSSVARSRKILQRLRNEVQIPSRGRLLDIGCGNGSLLKSASELFPDWTFVGTEFDDKLRLQIEAIPRVECLRTDPLEDIAGGFDLVTLSHVFEHLTSPLRVLDVIATLLNRGGLLVIQVPNYTANPFELLIADHCSHFSPTSLAGIASSGGFTVRVLATDWVPREITLVASPGDRTDSFTPVADPIATAACVASELSWLDGMRTKAAQVTGRPFGIFGTSIGGTWLHGELNGQSSFFVDEDIQRAGRTHLGLPIVLPRDISENSAVFVALPDPLALSVTRRLRQIVPSTVEILSMEPRA